MSTIYLVLQSSDSSKLFWHLDLNLMVSRIDKTDTIIQFLMAKIHRRHDKVTDIVVGGQAMAC